MSGTYFGKPKSFDTASIFALSAPPPIFLPHEYLICGIYFLYREGEIVYIGQSTDVISRVNSHRTEAEKEFDAFGVIRTDAALLSRLEIEFIKKFRPKLNIAHNTIEKPIRAATGRRKNDQTNAASFELKPYMNVIDAAKYVGVSVAYLNALRCKGGGPRFSRLGRAIRYARADLDAWIEGASCKSTSEYTSCA